jgi:hypothetical protein
MFDARTGMERGDIAAASTCGVVTHATLSPDGRRIAFAGLADGTVPFTTQVFTGALATAEGRRLWSSLNPDADLCPCVIGGATWVGDKIVLGMTTGWTGSVSALVPVATQSKVIALAAEDGHVLWRAATRPSSTRFGSVNGLATSRDQRVLYVFGSEGTPQLGTRASLDTWRTAFAGSSEGYVRAFDLLSHGELWTGRLTPKLDRPEGRASSLLSGTVVGDQVVVSGTIEVLYSGGGVLETGLRPVPSGILVRFSAR